MTTEWDNSPTISREAWRAHARELDRLLAAERAVNAACQGAVDEVDAENARLRGALEACQASREHYAAVAENALGEVRGLRRRDER